MKLQLPDASVRVLLELLLRLEELGGRPVLVGGLVPPLLRPTMDPENLYSPPGSPRQTSDCDLAIDVAVASSDRWKDIERALVTLEFVKKPKKNQFRWEHRCGLGIDPMPVAAGIEREDPHAIAFARPFVEGDTATFFRGYELAIELFVEVTIDLDDETSHPLRIAGIAAMLSMKLQAWTDRRYERRKDAQDIGWLLRYSAPEIVARHLLDARSRRPELVEEIIDRLDRFFSAEEHGGTNDAVSRDLYEEIAERHRNAIAGAVQLLLKAYRQG